MLNFVSMYKLIFCCVLCAAILGMTACSSTPSSQRPTRTVDDLFAEAMEAYTNNNFLEAQALFDVIKLQHSISQYADDAQYYLAEINFKKGEYILAAYNYNLLRRTHSASPFAKEAAYKVALSYDETSLPFDRDQEYTYKAIQAYSEFQSVYPADSLSLASVKAIKRLRNKVGEKYYRTAQQYVFMMAPKSTVIYCDVVINEFADTDWLEAAFLLKMNSQVEMQKYADARLTARQYRKVVIDPTRLREVETLEQQLPPE